MGRPPTLFALSEFSGSMQDTKDRDLIPMNFIEQPVGMDQQFSNVRVSNLGNYTPTLG
jgi:hypothetical protein